MSIRYVMSSLGDSNARREPVSSSRADSGRQSGDFHHLLIENAAKRGKFISFDAAIFTAQVAEFTFTKRREPWTLDLAGVIAEHYCCTSLLNHEYGKRTYAHLFVGLENDVEVCAEVFGYAMRFVYSRVKDIRRELKGFSTSYVRYECDNYGYGFADGLKNEFERQRGEHREWALVMVKPPEVVADTEGLKTKTFTSDKDTGGASYAEGFKEGGEFTPEKSLKEA